MRDDFGVMNSVFGYAKRSCFINALGLGGLGSVLFAVSWGKGMLLSVSVFRCFAGELRQSVCCSSPALSSHFA